MVTGPIRLEGLSLLGLIGLRGTLEAAPDARSTPSQETWYPSIAAILAPFQRVSGE